MFGVKAPIPGVVYPDLTDLARYVQAGLFSSETMGEAISILANRFPTRTAVSDVDRTLTYAELNALTDRIAAGMLALGLRPLDRVAFQIPNSIELIVSLVACLKAGIIPICTLTAHRSAEIGYLSAHGAARAHFISTADPKFDFLAFSREMRAVVPSLQFTIITHGSAPAGDATCTTLARLAELGVASTSNLADVEHDPCQVAMFQLSGGTSGVPKIIPRFHNEYLYQIRTMAAWEGLNENTVALSPAPMMHNAPIVCYWGSTFWSGGEVACCGAHDPAILAETIAKRKPSWMNIPLPLLVRLQEAGRIDREIFGQARMLAAAHANRIADMTGARVFPLYGMTEGIISCGRDSDPGQVITGTVGRPISPFDEFKIVDAVGQTLPDGEPGEFLFKGPSSCRGYYDATERNAEAFSSDGFCRSGDLMRVQSIGGSRYLSFEGRIKDVVSRGGEKINCQEVEQALIGHPGIGAIAIVPMPDPVLGEKACAFIIPGRDSFAPTVTELGLFLERKGLAKFKWPERIEIVDEFPMTSSGKVSKPRLREIIAGMLQEKAGNSV